MSFDRFSRRAPAFKHENQSSCLPRCGESGKERTAVLRSCGAKAIVSGILAGLALAGFNLQALWPF